MKIARLLIFIVLVIQSTFAFPVSIRTYSVTWRNCKDRIIKRVNYDESIRFTQMIKNEIELIDALPNGYEYDLIVFEDDKIVYKKIQHLSQ